MNKANGPRVLVFDIETSPMEAYVFDLRDQNIPLIQVIKDWRVLAFSAKWLDSVEEIYAKDRKPKMIYQEAREEKDEKALLQAIWKLLDEADIVITQNGERFDAPKLNARFSIKQINRGQPPSPYRHLDTCKIARRVFGFTSNKLEYLTDKLCTRYKKLTHKLFPGFALWKECLAGNKAAWAEMRRYNIHDVLATEELYTKIQAWDSSINFGVYSETGCCKNALRESRGYSYTSTGKYQRFRCTSCGKWSASKTNLLSKSQRSGLTKSAGAH